MKNTKLTPAQKKVMEKERIIKRRKSRQIYIPSTYVDLSTTYVKLSPFHVKLSLFYVKLSPPEPAKALLADVSSFDFLRKNYKNYKKEKDAPFVAARFSSFLHL